MPDYRVTWRDGRIGRHHDQPPAVLTADDADALAQAIHRHVRPRLMSRDVKVAVDLAAMSGFVFCGLRIGASFDLALSGVQVPAGRP
jgi:hypothetical protein